jgi:HD-like signal output (HDOD) protein
MTEQIIKKIKSLPPLPDSVQKVRLICDDPEASIRDLIPIIEQDPMFTADILKAANSPLYGFSQQITSIEQAVSLFGMGTIQGFAISYAIRKTIPVDFSAYGVTSDHLVRVSNMQNTLASRWGKKQVKTAQSEMLTLSLLMELGKVVSAIVLSESNKIDEFKSRIKTAETVEEITAIEQEILGIPSDWIAALMFKHWKFNESMIEIIRNIGEPEKASESLQKATQVLHTVKEAVPFIHPLCEPCLQSAYESADRYGLDSAGLQAAIDSLRSS